MIKCVLQFVVVLYLVLAFILTLRGNDPVNQDMEGEQDYEETQVICSDLTFCHLVRTDNDVM